MHEKPQTLEEFQRGYQARLVELKRYIESFIFDDISRYNEYENRIKKSAESEEV